MPEISPLTRLRFARDAFWRPGVALVAIPWTAWGALAFIRDEIVQPANVTLWKPIYWLPKLPWQVWLVVTCIAVVAVLFEGAYRVILRRDAEHAGVIRELSEQVAKLRETRPKLVLLMRPELDSDGRSQSLLAVRNDGDAAAQQVTLAPMRNAGGDGIEFALIQHVPPRDVAAVFAYRLSTGVRANFHEVAEVLAPEVRMAGLIGSGEVRQLSAITMRYADFHGAEYADVYNVCMMGTAKGRELILMRANPALAAAS